MSAKFSGVELNPEGPYLSLEKEKEHFCAVFTNYSSIERALQRRAQVVVFFSLLSPLSLIKLSIVVIQNFFLAWQPDVTLLPSIACIVCYQWKYWALKKPHPP